MDNIIIKEVSGRCQLRKFIQFPNRLFKDVPTYIPPLMFDEVNLLTSKNPSLEHCDLKLWLAWHDGKIVGRVAGIINHSVNERWNKKAVRFGWFDFVEDYDVFEQLLNTVADWGRGKGMTEIEGPFGFTDMDKECWVIEGFDQRQNLSTLYNPKYYIDFITRAGYEIPCQWAQYKIFASQPIPEKVGRLNKLILEKYHLRELKFKNRKEIYPYAWKFFHTINESFKDLYDFVPMTEKEIGVYIKQYIPFVNLDFVSFIADQDDNLVAFALIIPDLNKGYQKAKGRLFPFGWYHILRSLHHFTDIDLLLNGVHPDWQKRGVHSIYYAAMSQAAIDHNVQWSYSNPQIIGNEAQRIWDTTYKADPMIKRAVFKKAI
ncbi:MAG: hypothetical protein J6X88_08015 [Bacteroidales bacterium]|nr:hypothetical protein [Bacteroidales bacterium]